MEEIWKDIRDYEGLYQVSNLGNVRSLRYNHTEKIKLLKQGVNKKGYKYVRLFKNGKGKTHIVHRLVAMSFIPNPNNLPIVNHIDECKSNNMVSNLEWCTLVYNNAYGTRNKRISKSLKGKTHSKETKKKMSESRDNKKSILMYDLSGNFIRRFECINDTNEYFDKDCASSNVRMCLKGATKTAYNYIFVYADDDQVAIKDKINKINRNKKPILMFTKDGEFVRRFECVKDTNEYFGKKRADSNVNKCLIGKYKTVYGYIFKYEEEDNK